MVEPDVFTGGVAPQALATNMHAAWVEFMKTGDPSTSQLPPWPSYETGKRSTMMLNAECKVEDDPNREFRELWEGLL